MLISSQQTDLVCLLSIKINKKMERYPSMCTSVNRFFFFFFLFYYRFTMTFLLSQQYFSCEKRLSINWRYLLTIFLFDYIVLSIMLSTERKRVQKSLFSFLSHREIVSSKCSVQKKKEMHIQVRCLFGYLSYS